VKAALDIEAARAARPYSRSEYVKRVLWAFCRPLFRFSPRPLFGWRALLLRAFGAKVGRNVHIYPRAEITLPWMLRIDDGAAIADEVLVYNLGPVHVGARATISHRAQLCAGTHDYRDPSLPLLRVPVHIGAEAWVCTAALVGPGVSVGEGAVVGAGAVVLEDVEPWMVVAGNPARPVKRREMRSP
jgi:putative colanic acid biosynthesis acetyltransferase WcaF